MHWIVNRADAERCIIINVAADQSNISLVLGGTRGEMDVQTYTRLISQVSH